MKKETFSDMVNSSQPTKEKSSLNDYFTRKTIKFNNQLIVSHDGGRLSSDVGLILIDALMDAFDFTQLSEAMISFKEDRKYWKHSKHKILKQLVLQIIAGYDTDSAANLLRHDPVLQTLLPDGHLVSQSSISRNLKRVSDDTIDSFQVFNQALIDKARLVRNDTNMVIDSDSTHSDTSVDKN